MTLKRNAWIVAAGLAAAALVTPAFADFGVRFGISVGDRCGGYPAYAYRTYWQPDYYWSAPVVYDPAPITYARSYAPCTVVYRSAYPYTDYYRPSYSHYYARPTYTRHYSYVGHRPYSYAPHRYAVRGSVHYDRPRAHYSRHYGRSHWDYGQHGGRGRVYIRHHR